MNSTLRKFLNFYTIELTKENNEYKYYTNIKHTFLPKEELTKLNKIKFAANGLKKLITSPINWVNVSLSLEESQSHRDYIEDTSVNGMELLLEFIPEQECVLMSKDVKTICGWESSSIPDTPMFKEERVYLHRYASKIIDNGGNQIMSESFVDKRIEEDEYIEIIKGSFMYPDLKKIYQKIHNIIYDNVSISIDQRLFIKLLDEGHIFGRELFLNQVDKSIHRRINKK